MQRGRCTTGAWRIASARIERKPFIKTHRVDIATNPYAGLLGRRRLARRLADLDQCTIDARAVRADLPMQRAAHALTEADRDAVIAGGDVAPLDAQRRLVRGGLAQRRRQVDRGTLQRRFERPRDMLIAHVERKLPVGSPGEAVDERDRVFTANCIEISGAGGVDARAPCLARDVELERSAERLGHDAGRAHRTLAEFERSAGGRHRRHAGEPDRVRRECILADNLHRARIVQRKIELEAQHAVALRGRAARHAVGPLVKRRLRNELQEARSGTLRRTGDAQHRRRAVEIGDLRARRADVRTERARRRCCERDARAVDAHVGGNPGDRRPVGRVFDRRILRLRREQEAAALSAWERKLREVAVEHQLRIARRARDERPMQPIPHGDAGAERHVAPRARDAHAREFHLDVDVAGPVRARPQRAGCRAGCVTVGERDTRERDRGGFAVAFPADVATQCLECDRLGEDRRQRERRLAAVEANLAAALARFEAACEVDRAGVRVGCGDPRIAKVGLCGKPLGRLDGTHPFQDTVAQRPARIVHADLAPQRLPDRQLRRNRGQWRERELGNGEAAACCALTVGDRQREIGRRMRNAVRQRETHLTRHELRLPGRAFPGRASREMRKRERCKSIAERRARVVELEVRGHRDRLRLREIDPRAERTVAAVHRERQWQPFAPRADVRVFEPQIHPPAQTRPVVERVPGDVDAQVQRRGDLRRRHAGQAGVMAAKALLQAKVDVIEQQLRRAPVLVVPRDERVANDNLRLPHQPIGERGVGHRRLVIAFDAGEVQLACGIASHGKPRSLDQQLLHPQVQQRHRGPCDRQIDPRQLEQDALVVLPVANAKAAHFELGVPAVPAGLDGVDLDRLTDAPRKPLRDIGAAAFDLRKRDEPNGEQQREERAGGNDDGHREKPQRAAHAGRRRRTRRHNGAV